MVRSRWLAVALAIYAVAGAVALAAWAVFGAGDQLVAVTLSAVLWLVCSLLVLWFWRTAPSGTLVWSGSDWTLESPQGQALSTPSPRLQVHLDLQHRLWLRLQPESSQAGSALWLWLERRSQPALWDDVRRAVYSPARSGSANASNITPHSDSPA